jgi:hypothetical protein
MKTIKFLGAFALVAILSITTISATPTGTYDVVLGAATTSVTVNLTKIKHQIVTVKILDANDNTLMNETIKDKADVIKKYNMTQLADGSYEMIITKEGSRINQPFSIKKGSVVLSETDKKETFFPVFRLKNDQLNVDAFLGHYGKITVSILNEEGNKVFTQTDDNVYMLHKSFDVSKLFHGNYKVEVQVGNEVYYYDLNK